MDTAPKEQKTQSGIIMPESMQEETYQATVLAADETLGIPEGTVIMYAPGTGFKMKVDGQEVLLLSKYDLIGIIQ